MTSFDNRNSSLVLKGAIDRYFIDEATDKKPEHLCLVLNTGFNVLLELDKLLDIVEKIGEGVMKSE